MKITHKFIENGIESRQTHQQVGNEYIKHANQYQYVNDDAA